jgi:Putative metal-binding motif
MRKVVLATAMWTLFGCDATTRHGGGTGGNGGGGTGGGGSGGGASCPQNDPSKDGDGDGFTPAQGDCNDCDPGMNPAAIEIGGNGKDDDCNGAVDDANAACDAMAAGKKDGTSFAASIELCDARFMKSATFAGPSDDRARNVLANFGILKPRAGANFALLSSGIAVDESGAGFINPQIGTELGNMATNPLPNLMGASDCGQGAQNDVNDYTELVLTLKVPSNVNSFSFEFQFFSGEYPNFVCSMYNDEFLAIVQSSKTYPSPTNISFDAGMHPITVNSGFFTVCKNDPTKPQTQHCMHPPSDNQGTGYEVSNIPIIGIPGGSTGWLSTKAPIQPGEDVTLRFVIFDEGDQVLDSAVLIDNFQWGAATVSGPSTGPIGYKLVKPKGPRPAPMCRSAGART